MTDALVLLDPPTALPAGEPWTAPMPAAGAVALLVDDSVAAIAATAWAARLARDKHTSLLVIVLAPYRQTRDEHAVAALARVQPTLDRGSRPYSVRVCCAAGAMTARRRAQRTARRVGALLPAGVSLLGCPGGGSRPDLGLVARLAASRTVDLLVVPDLSSVRDAWAVGVPAESDGSQPARAC